MRIISQTKKEKSLVPVTKNKQIALTPDDVKKIMLRNKDLEKRVKELEEQNKVLEMTLMSAGIVVDEKFGDDQNGGMRIPSQAELDNYPEMPDPKKQKSLRGSAKTDNWIDPIPR